MKLKTVAIALLIALIFSITAMATVPPSYVSIVRPEEWERRDGKSGQDFTFAFVGDIQSLTYYMDYKTGTNYVDNLFNWIADNAEEKKIAHVFTLGDLTDRSAIHDPTLSYGASDPMGNGATYDAEYEIVKSAISKLDGVVPYSIVRGNHDSYSIDAFFNYDAYTSNFDGFYREESGRYKDSITNSYRLVEIQGIKFIFFTIDFNPSRDVIYWMDDLLTTYSDYNAIITMHSYLTFTGDKLTIANVTDIQDSIVQGQYKGAAPDWIWKNCLSKHENVIMTVSGHVGADHPKTSVTIGENGNKVRNILVDSQFYDLNVQPTGSVMLMHFYDGGKTIKTEYYATAFDAYKYGSNYVWDSGLMISEIFETTTASETSVTTTTATTKASTSVAVTADDSAKNGCRASLPLASMAIVPTLIGISVTSIRKKED